VIRAHEATPFDVIHAPSYSACGLLLTVLLQVPLILRLSGFSRVWNELAGAGRSLDREVCESLEELQLTLARRVYAPSDSLRRLVQVRFPKKDIQVIPTTFALEPVHRDVSLYRERFEGKQYLLFFGRFQTHKGFHILAQALPHILTGNPNRHAVFIGIDCGSAFSASMHEYAKKICRDFADQLIFLGQTPHSQLYPIIAGAHLVVLPSLIDNLPNACLEAMALGRTLVGTYGTSFDEMLIDEETGFLVPPGNIEALADKVNAVWMRDDLDRIGGRACESVAKFHPDVTIPLLEHQFRLVIKEYTCDRSFDAAKSERQRLSGHLQ
jgi:glycosyltransferase involved in cell wall biosynthesis